MSGLALGHQAGDHQAGRGAQVGGHHGGALQAGDARHEGGVAVDLDVGAQALQLDRVHEAVLEDRLADHRGAVGDRVDGHELGLHVGREAPDRRGAQAHRVETGRRLEADRVGARQRMSQPASISLSITASR